jgi:hypothetical protein
MESYVRLSLPLNKFLNKYKDFNGIQYEHYENTPVTFNVLLSIISTWRPCESDRVDSIINEESGV